MPKFSRHGSSGGVKNSEPPGDLIFNPAFTPFAADFRAAHFDARRSIYVYCFFANIAEIGDSLIYTPEKEHVERLIPPKEVGIIYKNVDLFKLRSERKRWEKIKKKLSRARNSENSLYSVVIIIKLVLMRSKLFILQLICLIECWKLNYIFHRGRN